MHGFRAASVVVLLLAGGPALLAVGASRARPLLGLTQLLADPGADTGARLVVALASCGLALAGAWLTSVALVCTHDLALGLPERAVAGLWRPAAVRALVGVSLLCGVTPAAAATPSPPPAPAGSSGSDLTVLSGLPLPERPALGDQAREPAPAPATRRVRPGDSLWSVAADLLGARPTPAEVDRAWRTLYRANRSRVGDDPDLLHPGITLRLPASLNPTRRGAS
jgi:hypothetical protein